MSRILGAAIVMALTLAACGGENSDEESGGESTVSLDALTEPARCPVSLDSSALPDDLGVGIEAEMNDQTPGEPIVHSWCTFPAQPEGVHVSIFALPAEEGDDLFTADDALSNYAYNSTGVDQADFERTVTDLAMGDTAALEGSGSALAVRRVDVAGASDSIILVTEGDESAEQLSAVAEALVLAPADN